MTASTIGQRIKAARLAADLTQLDLADRTGLHEQTVSKHERGAVTPDLESLIAYAAAFEITIDQLLSSEPAIVGKGAP